MSRSVRVRCIVHRGDVVDGTFVELAEDERIVNIDHDGHTVYVYVERVE